MVAHSFRLVGLTLFGDRQKIHGADFGSPLFYYTSISILKNHYDTKINNFNIDRLIFSVKITVIMNDILIVYLTFSIVGLCFVLMTLPTIIARRIVERQKKEGIYKAGKKA